MQDVHDLKLLLDSHVAILVVQTIEEPRVIELFGTLLAGGPRPLFTWSVTEGLAQVGRSAARLSCCEPDKALREIKASEGAGVYLMCDLHPFLDDPVHIRLLKEIAQRHGKVPHTVVLLSHEVKVPPELRPFTARFEIALPNAAGIEQIVREEARSWAASNAGAKVRTERDTLQVMVRHLVGLTAADARRLTRAAIWDDGAITASDLPGVVTAKHRLLDQGGAVSFEFDTARFAEVGGLRALKRWLELRKSAFFEPEEGVDPPKGILLVGVQGGGKSLAAKAVAGAWTLPLLRLDFGTLFNKFFGETEKNLRDALETAALMAPCVLWVDEIEKALAEGHNDSGTARRMLGYLLTWMAERPAPVFLVATANDIEKLPPELIRKGRMDEIFFVDLPTPEIREEIFRIHLDKRGLDPEPFDLAILAEASEGFSGAEIEQAVVSARYLAREHDEPVNQDHLLAELATTRPLSVVMDHKIAKLRAWATERTVSAD